MTSDEAIIRIGRIKRMYCFEGANKEALDMGIEAIHAGEAVTKTMQTNADRIRAMSDEELAAWLREMWDCSLCTEHERLGDNPLLSGEQCDEKCEDHCLAWLKAPAKEDA